MGSGICICYMYILIWFFDIGKMQLHEYGLTMADKTTPSLLHHLYQLQISIFRILVLAGANTFSVTTFYDLSIIQQLKLMEIIMEILYSLKNNNK